jgi:predicted RNA-binding protein with PIN domain
MRLLIDGYNLLHASDLFGAGELAGTLRGSREALISFIADRLPAKERRQAVIVFDAQDAPAGLPSQYDYEGIDIRFARGYQDADAMIEEILEQTSNTGHLLVVSGDHRVQRAARSCGAKPVDSEVWFRELRHLSTEDEGQQSLKSSIGDNDQWIKEFSDPEALAKIEQQAAAAPLPKPAIPSSSQTDKPKLPKGKKSARNRKRKENPNDSAAKPSQTFGEGIFDPFPSGYVEEINRLISEDSINKPEKPSDLNNRNLPDDRS